MKIIYKQREENLVNSLCRFGVQNCCFKKLSFERDCSYKKPHHHAGFELHIVTEGIQKYEVEGTTYILENGSFLLICPNVLHTVLGWTPHTKKISITFNKQAETKRNCYFGKCSKRMTKNLDYILEEASLKKEISSILIENNILEILVWLSRLSGIEEKEDTQKQDEIMVVSLAKQYIVDNIETPLRVTDVSEYCHLSTKQLTRLFRRFEGMSAREYITQQRVARIEKLLADQSYSLKRISEIMNFNNEYYFNAFLKKHLGIPPGEYRKMLGE